MGFSVAAAGGILVIGFLFCASVVANSYLSTQNEVQASMKEAELRMEQARQGEMQIDGVAYAPGPDEVTIDATNMGSVTYNLTKLDVLVDGVVHTADVTQMEVENTATNVWPPLTALEIIVDNIPSSPSSVQIVAASGVQAFWRA